MTIKTAVFSKSSNTIDQCPEPSIPEYAFIGRSNVGKSSLINMLLNDSSLAKTSGQPGKTRLINHFLINKTWYLVDLPGYGYAKVAKDTRNEWEKRLKTYLAKRENLECTFVLVDSRVEPQKLDIELCNWLVENDLPFVIVFTKADKQSENKTLQTIEQFKIQVQETWSQFPDYFITSAQTKAGKDGLLKLIGELNTEF